MPGKRVRAEEFLGHIPGGPAATRAWHTLPDQMDNSANVARAVEQRLLEPEPGVDRPRSSALPPQGGEEAGNRRPRGSGVAAVRNGLGVQEARPQ